MQNELSKDLRAADIYIQYDAQVKKVLGNKIVLAWILQHTVKAFSELTPEEIVPYIEGEPQIGTETVHYKSEKITGDPTEDKVPGEGTVYYDILFHAVLPDKKTGTPDPKIKKECPVSVMINVEAQKDFYPGYCIESRGVFYCSRMISAQMGREFTEPHYDDLKKVYSVWLCMNVPKYVGNAVAEYKFGKYDIIPGMPDRKQAYDKQSVILICLNDKAEEKSRLSGMLNTLLSPDLYVAEKKKILEIKYGISMEKSMEAEVNLMCNLSEWVEARGIEKGRHLGREEGKSQEQEKIVLKMLASGTMTDDTIVHLSGISRERLENLKAVLS